MELKLLAPFAIWLWKEQLPATRVFVIKDILMMVYSQHAKVLRLNDIFYFNNSMPP